MYELVTAFMNNAKAEKHKELWQNLAIYYFLTGRRRSEPFLLNPIVRKVEDNGSTYYRVRTVNEKHTEGSGQNKRREVFSSLYKPVGPYETALWNTLMHGKPVEVELDFKPLLGMRCSNPDKKRELLKHFTIECKMIPNPNPKHKSKKFVMAEDPIMEKAMAGISKRFSSLFKWNITNGRKIISNGGIPIHALRHQQTIMLMVEKKTPPHMAQRIMGWSSAAMPTHYSDIRNTLKERELIDLYEHLAIT